MCVSKDSLDYGYISKKPEGHVIVCVCGGATKKKICETTVLGE